MITGGQRDPTSLIRDPFKFMAMCWPDIKLYDKQAEIIESVIENDDTIVPAGNALGKDFIAAFIALWFFLSRRPARVITHSVDQPQLKNVLWGEMRRFIANSRHPLPLRVSEGIDTGIRRNTMCSSYLIGRVTRKGEGLLGHHEAKGPDGEPRTLFIADESSGIDNEAWEAADTWAHRRLAIGNPYPCENFFKKSAKEGDRVSVDGTRYYQKIIQIKAEHSPNVRLAEKEIKAGKQPSNKELIPGVKSYDMYSKHRITWDPTRQSIGLDAEFPEGADIKLFPPDRLDRAERLWKALKKPNILRRGKITMGVDSAEGNDFTCWVVVSWYGLIKIVSMPTHDTSDIPGRTIALMNEYGVQPENVNFDRGGGGKQHADRLRADGYKVNTVGFGESASDPRLLRRLRTIKEREEEQEGRYIYKNRRAEMYGLAAQLLDPEENEEGFCMVPVEEGPEYAALRTQLNVMPKKYDSEGRMYLPPKDKRGENSQEESIREMLGRSPDEADAFVLAVFGQFRKSSKTPLRAMI